MERLTDEVQIGPFAALKDKAEAVPGAFGTYDCFYAHGVAVTQLKQYEDTGLEPETVNDLLERFQSLYDMVDDLDLIDRVHFQAFLERVRRWTQAEKDGRLVVLPVPIGKNKLVFALPDSFSRNQEIFTIDCERLDGLEIWENPGREIVIEVDGCEIGESDIGKTVFLTREEAEAALKKREEADDETD